jgi:uncharacterized protein
MLDGEKGTAFVRGRTRRRFRYSAFIGLGLAILVLGVGFEELVRVGSPPPLPVNAGTLPLPRRGVTSLVRGVETVGTQYGPCVRVLAIDGGGMRGIVPALILAEIEKRTGKPIAAQFDLIAGTSTGAILALGLTRPADSDVTKPAFAADDLVNFYRQRGRNVFPRSFRLLRKLRWMFSPKYNPAELESLLNQYFSDVQFQEALTNVLVPAYDIGGHRRIWFSQWSTPTLLMRDVLRGAIAAPTYIPPVRFAVTKDISPKGYVTLVDGGLFANDPSPEALSRSGNMRLDHEHRDNSLLLLSLGTGANATDYSFEEAWRWGAVGWVNPLLEIAVDVRPNEAEVERLMQGKDYVRLQLDFKGKAPELDDSSDWAVGELTAQTQKLIDKEKTTLDLVALSLSLPRSPQCGMMPGLDRETPTGPRRPHKTPHQD